MAYHWNQQPQWRQHISGLYYVNYTQGGVEKTYLPQVDVQAHTSILSTTSRTVLTQTFINPSAIKGIKEVRYSFPLYDGVSVVGFTCHVGDRTIVGEVKEKEKARAVFEDAVANGQTAGLLEQLPDASDVFTTTVGNVPPGAKVIIRITYLGELKHDMEVDGIRFTIPNIICPRYGTYPGSLKHSSATDAYGGSLSITVDAEMAEGSFIQQIRSPSHPIAVNMGTTTFAPNDAPSMSKASATLSLGTAQLDTDFVLQVIAKDNGIPKAILEMHPRIPNQRALMATLVPKFSLPADKPEVVFVCDRSGSMSGRPIELAKQALKIFLKSLPVGVKFNIASFGSNHSFLWPRSASYSQQTLEEAVRHIEGFSANYGGTEMLPPLRKTIEQRYKDMPLEVMVLTDGETWDQQNLFNYLNEEIGVKKAPIRVFTLGIGSGVSSALIEGVARAGKGFAQAVADGEKMDSKVVRMLKGALSPHVDDYRLEVKYSEELDDFELVEKITDSLSVRLNLDKEESDKKEEPVGFQSQTMRAFFTDYNQKEPISLFDTNTDPDKEDPPAYDETGEARYAHLPGVPVPKVIQAPQNIPSLFAFIRTTVYLLLGPDAPQETPKSVVLRGNSKHGPLELEIPIQVLDLPGEMVHQLAAKKAIAELEQGRGWLPEAKDSVSGKLLKEQFDGRFEEMVEREAVRLGVQYQVGGKWCSFVAVEKESPSKKQDRDYEWLDREEAAFSGDSPAMNAFNEPSSTTDQRQQSNPPSVMAAAMCASMSHVTQRGEKLDTRSTITMNNIQPQSQSFYAAAKKNLNSGLFGLSNPFTSRGSSGVQPQATGFSNQPPAPAPAPAPALMAFASRAPAATQATGFGATPSGSRYAPCPSGPVSPRVFGAPQVLASAMQSHPPASPAPASLFGNSPQTLQHATPALFGGGGGAIATPPPAPAHTSPFSSSNPFASAQRSRVASHTDSSWGVNESSTSLLGFGGPEAVPLKKPQTDDEALNAVVSLQTFEGYWNWNAELFNALSLSWNEADKLLGKDELQNEELKTALATALTVAFLETKLTRLQESWELIVDKAREWLGGRAADLVTRMRGAL